ncbi:MAG: acetoin utilization protein AcuC, partial [Dietzia sp.]|nr:acetoin utilization protein AcuC [Dietzia sp.]
MAARRGPWPAAAGTRPHERTRLVWSPALLDYDFGARHPMTPLRLDLTFRLAEQLGVLAPPGVEVVGAEPADDAVLGTAHTPE